jgi:hypothetical protein
MLAILLLTHWLSALTLTPAMFALIKPRFARGEGLPAGEERLLRIAARKAVAREKRHTTNFRTPLKIEEAE